VDVTHSFLGAPIGGQDGASCQIKQTPCGSSRNEPGLFLGQCAKYCGTQHSFIVGCGFTSTAREDFDRWVKEQQAFGSADPMVAAGRQVFETERLHQLPLPSEAR